LLQWQLVSCLMKLPNKQLSVPIPLPNLLAFVQPTNLRPRHGGYIPFVLSTAFETSQGKSMRTILFSIQRVAYFPSVTKVNYLKA
jgi:hypothetical protein